MNNKVPVLWNNESDCCGCSACAAVCPAGAIDYKQNNSGFFFPEINNDKCIGCSNCIKICTFKNDKKELNAKTRNIYAAKAKNDILLKSSSGGLFTVLSDYFLQNGGAVISAIYDPDSYKVRSILYDNIEMREKAHGSKYIESNIGGVFIQAVQWLKEHGAK